MSVRRRYVDGGFGQIHLRECGSGDPVLLLHQSPVSSLMFEPALPYLADAGFHAIAIDTPGYGMSTPPSALPTIDAYGDAIAAVMDAFGFTRTHLVGHHTGSSIAACFAARHPDRIDRLILNGLVLLSDQDKAQLLAMDLRPPPIVADGSHLLKMWQLRTLFTPGWTDLVWLHRFLVESLVAGENTDWATRAAVTHDIAADLQQITVPTLLLTNTGDNLRTATGNAAALRPDMAFLTLDGGTQDFPVEHPEAWSWAIIEFLGTRI